MVTTTEEAGRKRWRGVGKEEHRAIASKGGKTSWANMTPEERSAENKRRAQVRAQNRAKKSAPRRRDS
jgi:hypothetical protein